MKIGLMVLALTLFAMGCGRGIDGTNVNVVPSTGGGSDSGGGDSGGGGGGGGSTPTGCNPCRIYTTAAALPSAGLGATAADALSAADSFCMADTKKPATGTFKAMLYSAGLRVACTTPNCSGGASENVNWVFAPNRTYYRTDGTTAVLTTNAAGIFTFPTTAPIEASADYEFWAGLNTDFTGASWTCLNWTSSANTEQGRIGSSTYDDDHILVIGAENCDTNYQGLLCVEQ